MGTTSALHTSNVVALCAKGFTVGQIGQQLGGQIPVKEALAEACGTSGFTVDALPALAIAFVDSLPPEERAHWNKWALSSFNCLPMSTPSQRHLLRTLSKKTMARRSLAEIAECLTMSEDALTAQIEQILGHLPGVQTRAGLVTLCYLVRHIAAPLAGLPEHLPRPTLTVRQMETLRLVARGHTYEDIAATFGVTMYAIRTRMQYLMGVLGVNRPQAALVYLQRYQPAEERAAWQNQVQFQWPSEGQYAQRALLRLLLTWEFCGQSNGQLGKLLFLTRTTINTHMIELLDRLWDWPRTRIGVMTAAALHMPE